MYAVIPYFQDSYDSYGYEYWESQVEDFFSYFELTTEEKCRCARLRLMEKPNIGGMTTISYMNLDFSCKVFFMLGMLCTFIQYLSLSLNKSASPKANKSQIHSISGDLR